MSTLETPLTRDPPRSADLLLASAALDLDAAAYQAFWLLRIGFTFAPILFGIDKFFNWTVYWPNYLAPWINNIVPGSAQDFMYVVGGIEIVAGLLVAFTPRIGAFVVAGWLAGWHCREPIDQQRAPVLRHRAARLWSAAWRAHTRPTCPGCRACP